MPDQGPGLINKFRPTALSFNAYGWKGSPQYNRADVPSQWVEGVGSVDRTIIEQQLAYEWLNSSDAGGPGNIWTNPPFLSGAAGRLMSGMVASDNTPARILRGFIRRSEADISDVASMSRLYFMYNPEKITRQYVSYLDQGALDPFNTVFQSGNLVAPPSYMDFQFDLFFDRQEEAVIASNPGVFVDYQYFDMVVRNVIPATDPNAMNSALPDNGVMMVNPRDITVVFSPQITVQGRPSNATVNFTRFTHRMVPTRMEISLTMRVTYFGPLKDMTPYVKDEAVTAATIPFTEIADTYQISVDDLIAFKGQLAQFATDIVNNIKNGDLTGGIGSSVGDGTPPFQDPTDWLDPSIPSGTSGAVANTAKGSAEINGLIVDYAEQMVKDSGTKYVHNTHTWQQADCSGLVYRAFMDTGHADVMGWKSPTFGIGTSDMWYFITHGLSKGDILFQVDGQRPQTERYKVIKAGLPLLQKGDLLFRINMKERPDSGHVAWFVNWANSSKTSATIFAAMSPTDGVRDSVPTADYIAQNYTGAFRPYTAGADTVATTPRPGPS